MMKLIGGLALAAVAAAADNCHSVTTSTGNTFDLSRLENTSQDYYEHGGNFDGKLSWNYCTPFYDESAHPGVSIYARYLNLVTASYDDVVANTPDLVAQEMLNGSDVTGIEFT